MRNLLLILSIVSFSIGNSNAQRVVEEVDNLNFLKSEFNNSKFFAEVTITFFKEYIYPDSLNPEYTISFNVFESKKEEVGRSFGVGAASAGRRLGIGISANRIYENNQYQGFCEIVGKDIPPFYRMFNTILSVSGELKVREKASNTTYVSQTHKNLVIGCEVKESETQYFLTIDEVTFKFENNEFFQIAKFLSTYSKYIK
jgi:hypothetical protein